MAEEANPQAAVLRPPAETLPLRPEIVEPEVKDTAGANGNVEIHEPAKEVAPEPEPEPVQESAPVETQDPETTNDKQTVSDEVTQEMPAVTQDDIEMKDEMKPDDSVPAADESLEPVDGTPASAGKSKARRKSGGVPEHKNKKLNKKASKAKITHTDAQPGDYFYVRLKGYPLWPAIVCDETMLPNTLIKSRPVTAARPDGTYRADYEDGGAKVKDRTFPVMYLHTNEFGWIPNFDLVDLDFDDVANVQSNIRKDLYAAHILAAEKHDLDYFKEILKNFMEARQAELEAKEAAKAAKKANKVKRKSKPAVDEEEDADVEMPDAVAEPDSEEADATATGAEASNKKKRKQPEDPNTPQTDSVKKPRPTIKLTNTPKATNGASTPKSAKDQSAAKSSKPKSKKAAPKAKESPEVVVPKEPELTAEEKRQKKEKEILFLRHKLQKGLLTRDQEPKEEEMKQMSEFVTKLEGYADLEVSIIRATKINKVLKAILKLGTIPKEEEFQFKLRSQTLLDKWNKLLASEQGTPAAAPTATNGTSPVKTEAEDAKPTPPDSTNGVKESSSELKADEKAPVAEPTAPAPAPETKEAPSVENATAPRVEEIHKEPTTEPTTVESTA